MLDELYKELEQRMEKSVASLLQAFNRIRTGRAHPSLLDDVKVEYYNDLVPLNQAASIQVEEARTLLVSPWEKSLIPEIDKAIRKADLGLNPVVSGGVLRIPLPPLTKETRLEYIRQARQEAENYRVSIRNARREANADIQEMHSEKMIGEDEERQANERIQKLTDDFIAKIDQLLESKEKDLQQV